MHTKDWKDCHPADRKTQFSDRDLPLNSQGVGIKRNGLYAVALILLIIPITYISFNFDSYATKEAPGTDFTKLRAHCASISPIAVAEFHNRQAVLAQTLYHLNASAYIAEPGPNALYYANISQSSWHLSERPFLLIVSPVVIDNSVQPKVTILTPKFEASRAKLLPLPAESIQWIEWAEEENPYEVVAPFLATIAGDKVYIAEASRLFIKDGIEAAVPTRVVTSAPLAIRTQRERKSPTEIALLRCVNEVTLLAIRAVRERMYFGIRQSETSALVEEALTAAGLSTPSALVLFGPNAAFPHGGPMDRTLARTEFVLFDVGASFHGYQSDVSRDSSIPLQLGHIWKTVQAAQSSALATARENVTAFMVDKAARDYITSHGYGSYFTHRLGHGIGLEGHEAPYLHGGSMDIIRSGHTFSNEPGIYIEGQMGVRLEDCFVIREDGTAVYLTDGVGGQSVSYLRP
ncbi:peptidase M24 [Hysterangium stoloniferum]|nr:peptidase M24 [Hysterangium stoloniferum]